MVDIPNHVKGAVIEPAESDGSVPVTTYYGEEQVGEIPDLSTWDVYDAVGAARDQVEEVQQSSLDHRIDELQDVGRQLEGDDELDTVIAQASGNPVAQVEQDREAFARFLQNVDRYVEQVFSKDTVREDMVQGKGVAGVIASSTQYQTQPQILAESALAGNSAIIKLDSTDPYSGYQVASAIDERDLPVQIVSYDRSSAGKDNLATEILEQTDVMPVMGPSELPQSLVQPASEEKHSELYGKLVQMVQHGGASYVHHDADVNAAADAVVEGTTQHLRSCKRNREVVVHPEVYEEFTAALADRFDDLEIGPVDDYNTDIPEVSDAYWDVVVDPYRRTALREGEELVDGDGEKAPVVVEQPTPSAIKMETPYATLGVHKGAFTATEDDAYDTSLEAVAETMVEDQPRDRLLELSLLTNDEQLAEDAANAGLAYNVHYNAPTTDAQGKPHEGMYMAQELSDVAGYRSGTGRQSGSILAKVQERLW